MTELRDVDPDQVERAAKEPSGQLEPVHIPGPRAGKTDLPDGRFINRELSWLDFNARVLALAEEPETPAARAREVSGDLRHQPGRVLHGSGGRAQAADRPQERPDRRRPDHRRAAQTHQCPRGRTHGAPCLLLHQRRPACPRSAGAAACLLPRPRPRRPVPAGCLLPGARVPGTHAAGRRPRPSLPLHQRAVAEPGRHRQASEAERRAVRADQGAAERPPVRAGRGEAPGCPSRN